MNVANLSRRAAVAESPYRAEDLDELAFALSQIVLAYLPVEPTTSDYYGVLGALEGVKLEFFRLGLATHNDQQEDLNGGVGFEHLSQNRG